MKKLDNLQTFAKLDKYRVGESIELLPDQMRQVLDDARLIKVPSSYRKAAQIVVNGMGGSNIGVGIAKSAFAHEAKLPISITPGYSVPAHVNKNTLYIISSYSGTTEEPLSAYRGAKKRGAMVLAITGDKTSKLAKLMMKEDIPGYIFEPRFNPSNQPRLGTGYSIFGVATLLAKAGVFKINVAQMKKTINELELETRRLRVNVKTITNPAKQIALQLFKKQPVLIGAEHLLGNVRALRNQICESSKNHAEYLPLPDLNHYAMEGLRYPASLKKTLAFVFFDSGLYDPRVQLRSRLTKQVIKKNKINVISHTLKFNTKTEQAFELLQLGSWVCYYLGILNGVDPVKIPWVDWFKKNLK